MHTLRTVDGIRVAVIDDVTLPEARSAIREAIVEAHTVGSYRLVIDYGAWTGEQLPSFAYRIDTVHEWSVAATAAVAVAVVLPRRLIHAERIGVLLARRLRFIANVFETVDDAVAWLVHNVDYVGPALTPRLSHRLPY